MKRSTSWIRRNPYGITLFLQKRIFIIFKMALITGSIICWVLIGLRCWERRVFILPHGRPMRPIFFWSVVFITGTLKRTRYLFAWALGGAREGSFPTVARGEVT